MTLDENLKTIEESIFEGETIEAKASLQHAIGAKIDPGKILNEAIFPAIRKIGESMEEGDFFMPEVKVSTKALLEVSELMKGYVFGAHHASQIVPPWTGEGDIDDIGSYLKNKMEESIPLPVQDQVCILEMVARGLNTHEFTPCKLQDKETRK